MSANGRFIARVVQATGAVIAGGFLVSAGWTLLSVPPQGSAAAFILVVLVSQLPGFAIGALVVWAGTAMHRRHSTTPPPPPPAPPPPEG